MSLPSGTVTFLFTDIEGSTKLWEQHPDAMRTALARHNVLLRQAIEDNSGVVFKTVGDAFFAAFVTAPQALAAALIAQGSLLSEPWPVALKVRMALHTGAAELRDNDYFGQPLNRVARLLSAGHGGQVLLSDVASDLCADTLSEGVTLHNLGAHTLRDLGRRENVFQLLHPALPADFPPLKSLDTFPNNLPVQLTSFIGRKEEIEAVKTLLDKTRLLTLTGSGGAGKTRLSLQVAADVLENYADGAWLVELAPLADSALVPQAVASVLGAREAAGKPIVQTLADFLKPKRLLLVLDNCEHVLDACARVADALLKNCPHVQILASSREALGIAGEQTYRIPSLSLPDARQVQTVESVSQYEAVRLFIERALAVQSTFAVTNTSAPALAQLCVRLDGIPLALELAAARVRSLSVEEINSKLDNCFRLLTGGSRTALPRQQTLRALIDWSFDLLNDHEKTLLCHLSVFAGGWTLEAAEVVGSGPDVEDWEVLDLLMSLADKSLVVAEQQEEHTRYRLLETVRQYARDRLAESGEGESVRERHQTFFLTFAEDGEPQLYGPKSHVWLHRLASEYDNLRTALEWRNNESALRIAGALVGFWWIRGYYYEGREWLSLALSGVESQTCTTMRAKALDGAGILASAQCEYAIARTLHEESLAEWRESGDKQGVAWSLRGLGYVAQHQGEYAAARALYEQCLGIYREAGPKWGVAMALNNLGEIAHRNGDHAAAHTLYEESLALRREVGEKRAIGDSLYNLGDIAHHQGDYTEARRAYQESLAFWRELGDKQGIAYTLLNLGLVSDDRSDYTAVRHMYEECLTIMHGLGEKHGIASSLEALAVLAYVQKQPERAPRLWGAAEALREAIGKPLLLSERTDYDQHVAQARSVMGEDAFAAIWAHGSAMTMEQAIEYALRDADVVKEGVCHRI